MGLRKETFTCEGCRNTFRTHSSSHGRFCSNACQREKEFRERLAKAIEAQDWSAGWAGARAKRAVIHHLGHQCSVCKRKTWQRQPIPLVMDHIDGDSGNWSFTNIRLVCGNCDMLLPTYKGKNKGNGRYARRERYKAGKSF